PHLPVTPDIDREEAARLTSKYNLLAIPVIDEQGRMLGIVSVDHVIDARVEESTEEAQRCGGMEVLDAPDMETGLDERTRQGVGSIRGDARRRHWLGDLLLGCLPDPAWNAALGVEAGN